MKFSGYEKHKRIVRLAIEAIAILSLGFSAFAIENVDLENEINRLKKELSQVRIERQRAAEDIARDKKEFADYQQRTATRKNECATETDSIKRQTVLLVQKKDSLAAIINASQIKRKQYELLQESFRQGVMDACARLLDLAKKAPAAISNQTVGALTFLINDCKAKTIDNIEALHRLMQIIQNLDDAGASIQIGQETSEVPEIRGSASMLRIGAVFEAIVDDDGKVCAYWSGVDSLGHERWDVIRDPAMASLVLKAILVRQGKALPSFIDLPYGRSVVKEVKK
jgi:hypothetical protein